MHGGRAPKCNEHDVAPRPCPAPLRFTFWHAFWGPLAHQSESVSFVAVPLALTTPDGGGPLPSVNTSTGDEVLSTRSLGLLNFASVVGSVSPSTQYDLWRARCPILPGGIEIVNQVGVVGVGGSGVRVLSTVIIILPPLSCRTPLEASLLSMPKQPGKSRDGPVCVGRPSCGSSHRFD